VFVRHHAGRPCPQAQRPDDPTLNDAAKAESGALMRVNHVGEVCAQALYTAQALVTKDPALRSHFEAAAREETDHLAWTEQRLDELGARTSLLNPLWYAGAFAIGAVAGRLGGDSVSLGFVVETERQVEHHLQSHLDRLPDGDHQSRAIVQQMKDDEVRHAQAAEDHGAVALPAPVQGLMRAMAKVMTTVAHRV
jgi:3-demethoxyubiquinol 3-hydroxylase